MNKLFIDDIEADIYYKKEYASLYTTSDAEIFEYIYSENNLYVKFNSLKRPIKNVSGIEISEEIYDLETPYGYGGPVSNSNDERFLKKAVASYKEHCKNQNIVCEFIRLHPFNHILKSNFIFDMFYQERQVVVLDLTESNEDRRKDYSKTTRNIVKKARSNLSIEINSKNIDEFIDSYYKTMEKNNADDFFFFDEKYFNSLSAIEGVKLIEVFLDDELASIGFFMFGSEVAHYHLSANNKALMKENGNYLLLDAAFDAAKEYGCKYMLLGGGRTSSTDDNLLKFKSKFSKIKMPFYIAGLEFLPEKRTELNELWMKQNKDTNPPNLFQLYRR